MIRRSLVVMIVGIYLVSGCGNRLINLERPKGQIEMRRPEDKEKEKTLTIAFDPATASLSKSSVDVTVRYASSDDLDHFLGNKEIFGNHDLSRP